MHKICIEKQHRNVLFLTYMSGLQGHINNKPHPLTVMQKAWRERNPQARIRAAYQAIKINHE